MALNAITLGAAMKQAIVASGAPAAVKAGNSVLAADEFYKALASAIVDHLKTSGTVIVVTACGAGAGTGTGTIA